MAGKLDIMLELEKRGQLPEDKKAILGELRKRGEIPAFEGVSSEVRPPQSEIPGARERQLAKRQQQAKINLIKSLNLPAVGSVGGGILGATGASVPTLGFGSVGGGVVGAGLGAAGGKSLEQLLLGLAGGNQNTTLGQNLIDVGKAGLEGVKNQIYGEGAGAIVGRIGGAVLPKIKNLSQSLGTSSFPQPVQEVSEALLRDGKTIGQEAAERGIYGFKRNVLSLLKSSKEKIGADLDSVLNAASSEKINPQNVVKELDLVKNRFLQLGNTEAAKTIEKRAADWLTEFSGGVGQAGESTQRLLAPAEANILKRQFANQAKQAFKQSDFTETAGVSAEFSQAMAKGIRKEIERLVPQSSFLNKEYHVYDQLSESIANSLARDLLRKTPPVGAQLATGEAAALGGALAGTKTGGVKSALAFTGYNTFPVQTFLAAQLAKFAKQPSESVAIQLMQNPVFRKAILAGAFSAKTSQKEK